MLPPGDFDSLPIEHETDSFCLVDATSALPKRPDKYYPRRQPGDIEEIVTHQTQGQVKPGRKGLLRSAKFFVANDDPSTDDVEGRGWAGFAYTFYVPFTPEFSPRRGQPIIYRCQPDDVVSNHTGTHGQIRGRNKTAVAVAFQGLFKSKSSPEAGRPSSWQRTLFRPFLRHLCARYGRSPIDIFTHSDFGKADCPGFEIEEWVGMLREETLRADPRSLCMWAERQVALAEAGFLRSREVTGEYDGPTRLAIEGIERAEHFPVTGLWSRPVDTFIRHLLTKENHS